MPHDALMERLQHIVGLEIAVERLEAKFKLRAKTAVMQTAWQRHRKSAPQARRSWAAPCTGSPAQT